MRLLIDRYWWARVPLWFALLMFLAERLATAIGGHPQ